MNLKEKVKDLATFAWNDLRHATDAALKSDSYSDFEAAMKQVHATERKLKVVRAHVRAQMRKTRLALQNDCPHWNKTDTRVRQTYTESGEEGRRIVEIQACTACSKEFDLREKVR